MITKIFKQTAMIFKLKMTSLGNSTETKRKYFPEFNFDEYVVSLKTCWWLCFGIFMQKEND